VEYGEGLWQAMVRKKYKIRGGIAHLRGNNSPVWNDLEHVWIIGTKISLTKISL
jgi:hypothetical protein